MAQMVCNLIRRKREFSSSERIQNLVKKAEKIRTYQPIHQQILNSVYPKNLIKDNSELLVLQKVGEGRFGSVHLCLLATPAKDDFDRLACKTVTLLPNGDSRMSFNSFLREGLVMLEFDHPNVLKLCGICSTPFSPLLIMEHMDLTDLDTWLGRRDTGVSLRMLYDFCHQIADGMAHIHSKWFVHRDLAPRNCLVDRNFTIKIGDFGKACKMFDPLEAQPGRYGPLDAGMYRPSVNAKVHDVEAFGHLILDLFERFVGTNQPTDMSILLYERCIDPFITNRPRFEELKCELGEYSKTCQKPTFNDILVYRH